MIISGSATLRTPNGLEIVNKGDLIFFEKGETGAHQFYKHTSETCVFLDIRTCFGYDIAEYPDSDKILLAPMPNKTVKQTKSAKELFYSCPPRI